MSPLPPLRLSLYTGQVDLQDGNTLLFNFPRRVADVLPTALATVLTSPSDSRPPDPELARYAEEVGYLVRMSESEEIAWFSALVKDVDSLNGSAAIVSVIPTNSCNLACSYCFQGNSGMRTLSDRHMTMDAARRIVETLDSIIGQRGVTHLELFGGEPLLPKTRDVVNFLVDEASRRGLTTRATTNAYFLDLFGDRISPSKIADLQISIDGPPEYHNTRRIPLSGAPTFDRILDNVKMAIDRGATVYIRPNIDKRNLEGLPRLIELLKSEGVLNAPGVSFDYVNVIPDPLSPDAASPWFVSREESEAILQRDVPHFARPTAPSLSEYLEKPMRSPQAYACGAPNRNLYFSPEGSIYNCHELVGRPDSAIGTMNQSRGMTFLPLAARWQSRRIDRLHNCQRCPLSYAHGGGCAARMRMEALDHYGNCSDFPAQFSDEVRRIYAAPV